MISIYDEKVEGAITAKLHEHEATKLAAERKMEAARNEMAEAERAVEHWRFALEDYRQSHGLSASPSTPSPVLRAEYSQMGPTDLVQHWAEKHDGEVVVKELAKVGVNAGLFPNYRHASSAIYAVVKRKGYTKIGAGQFKNLNMRTPKPPPFLRIPLGYPVKS